jgi:hypothetical protein
VRLFLSAIMLLGVPSSATAETVSYGYDVFGRLVGVGRFQGAADGLRDDIYYDSVDNRTTFYSRDTRITIPAGQSLSSPDGRTILAMQVQGNLVLYFQGKALWSTDTIGSGVNRMIMQSDGNLVLYTASGTAVWNSGTGGRHGSLLAIQNDGNLVIYDASRAAIWHTGTGGH